MLLGCQVRIERQHFSRLLPRRHTDRQGLKRPPHNGHWRSDASPPSSKPRVEMFDRDQARALLVELGGMSRLLEDADPAQRSRVYDALGLRGVLRPVENELVLTSSPRGLEVRVGGATCTITPRP